ncbi:MAG: BREX-1 system phosphatase PglZ type A [Desulfovibrionaceae bacterium]|nr:BREX-1 system phosphatase PglZ type A [Desulfovibrionaceae bacterium]
MDISTIEKALFPMFTPESPVVFWDDEGGEFAGILDSIDFAGHDVTLIRREEYADMELKVMLALAEGSQGRFFLLYSTQAKPPMEKDWLLDVRLYSREFHADTASMLLGELGIANTAMREHLKLRSKFFASQERTAKVKKLIFPNVDEDGLDLAILAVIVKADKADFSSVLLPLLIEQFPEGKAGLMDLVTTQWTEIEKYGLAPFFWKTAEEEFGYKGLKQAGGVPEPNLKEMLRCLLVTDLANEEDPRFTASLGNFVLGERYSRYASIFCSDWRNNSKQLKHYVRISGIIADELGIQKTLNGAKAEELGRCGTFEAVERAVITNIVYRMPEERSDVMRELIRNRRGLFWDEWKTADNAAPYHDVYDGLDAMAEIKALREAYRGGFHYASADEMVKAYTSNLFRFDQCYRHFCLAEDRLESTFDVLKIARRTVEGWITDAYCRDLASCWETFLPGNEGLLSHWKTAIPRQKEFFSVHPYSVLDGGKARAFVIISDGLRYEVGEELCRSLNGENRFKASISSMMAGLPCITKTGMAALLPHSRITFKPGTTDPLVDGKPCASIEQRDAILRDYGNFNGRAITDDELLSLKKEAAREQLKDVRLLYIYHNDIDSCGDHAATEDQTFAACSQAITRIKQIVRFIIDSLNGSQIFITSDHGFLYQESKVDAMDKASASTSSISGIVDAKKRYIFGHNLPEISSAWHGKTSVSLGMDDGEGMEFLVPKGTGRFHFMGGAQYTHGGAMPQEVIVPVIHVTERTGKALKTDQVTKVNVQLLNTDHRITSNTCVFRLFQTDIVDDRHQPRTLDVFLSDGSQAVSNEESVVFDSSSGLMDDKKKYVTLHLKKMDFDRNNKYFLILRDQETQVEYLRIDYVIDIMIQSLF